MVAGWGSALSGKTDYTLFQVITEEVYGSFPVITSSPPSGGLWEWITEWDTEPGIYWGHGNACYRMFSAALVPGQPYLLTYCTGLGTGPHFYLNGVELTVWRPGPSGDIQVAVPPLPPDVTLGCYYDGSLGLTGQIGAMLWYDRYLVDADRVQIEAHLMTKYGL